MVILISIDGFRYDYLEKFKHYNFSNIQKFIADGVQAEYIEPVFPSMTFPNHMSIVTGLYAESHGIVNNRMFDPLFNATYSLGSEEEFKSRWVYNTTITENLLLLV